jgi:gas vesicle protein
MKKEKDDTREETGSSTKLTYLLIGGAIGALLALLFAPKSGEELRADIADTTRRGLQRGRDNYLYAQEAAGEYYEVTREKAGDFYSVVTGGGARAETEEHADRATASGSASGLEGDHDTHFPVESESQ